jgi:uncharacterized repeat protein (TIGR02543 family)
MIAAMLGCGAPRPAAGYGDAGRFSLLYDREYEVFGGDHILIPGKYSDGEASFSDEFNVRLVGAPSAIANCGFTLERDGSKGSIRIDVPTGTPPGHYWVFAEIEFWSYYYDDEDGQVRGNRHVIDTDAFGLSIVDGTRKAALMPVAGPVRLSPEGEMRLRLEYEPTGETDPCGVLAGDCFMEFSPGVNSGVSLGVGGVEGFVWSGDFLREVMAGDYFVTIMSETEGDCVYEGGSGEDCRRPISNTIMVTVSPAEERVPAIADGSDIYASVGEYLQRPLTREAGLVTQLTEYTFTAPVPDWLHIQGPNLVSGSGFLYGVPPVKGVFPVSVKVENEYGTDSWSGSIVVGEPPVVTTAGLSGGAVGRKYGEVLTASGDPSIAWSVVPGGGGLPDGLVLDGSTGAISGTPETAGDWHFTVRASNQFGFEDKALRIEVVEEDGLYTASAGAGGVVSGTVSGRYAEGAVMEAVAVPDAGFVFDGWTVTGVTLPSGKVSSEQASFVMPAGDVTLRAGFVRGYEFRRQAGGGGNVVGTRNGLYRMGEEVRLQARADGGFEFLGWTVTGVVLKANQMRDRDLVFAMPAKGVTVTANFRLPERKGPPDTQDQTPDGGSGGGVLVVPPVELPFPGGGVRPPMPVPGYVAGSPLVYRFVNGEFPGAVWDGLESVVVDGHVLSMVAEGDGLVLGGFPGFDGRVGVVSRGSVVLTLDVGFLDGLSGGVHVVQVGFGPSAVGGGPQVFEMEFTVEPEDSAGLGDGVDGLAGDSQPGDAGAGSGDLSGAGGDGGVSGALWGALAAVGGVFLGVLVVAGRRKARRERSVA